MKKLLLGVFVFASFFCFGQVMFQKKYGGFIYSVEQTNDGGYILGGSNSNPYFIKVNEFGDTVWTKTYVWSFGGYISSIHQTSNGEYISSGIGGGGNPALVIKLDSVGNLQWSKYNYLNEFCIARSIIQTSAGQYVFFGTISGLGQSRIMSTRLDSNGNVLTDPSGAGPFFHNPSGFSICETGDGGLITCGVASPPIGQSIFIARTNSSNNVLWCKTYGNVGMQFVSRCIIQTTDGGFAVCGIGDDRTFLLKVDANGNVLLGKSYAAGEAQSMNQTVDGGFIIAGYHRDTERPYLVKTDSIGNLNWSMTYGDNGNGFALSVDNTSDGGYVVSTSQGYLIKTNSLGNSGCSQNNADTIVTSLSLVATNEASSLPGNLAGNNSSFTQSAGSLDSTLCFLNCSLSVSTTSPPILCYGDSISATAIATGGTEPYTYSWSPTGDTTATLNNVPAGNYTVTVFDSVGCSAIQVVSITEPPLLIAYAQVTLNALCNGQSSGSANVNVYGGTSPYSYSWLGTGCTTYACSNLAAGCYTVSVTDANGCTVESAACITEPPLLTANTQVINNVSCNGQSNGSAWVAGVGGNGSYFYTWYPSFSTNATITGLSAGCYTVTVSDINTCLTGTVVCITEPPPLVATICNQTSLLCYGDSNACVTACATGGVPPYSFTWCSSITDTTFCGLTAGQHCVTAYDANGCSVDTFATINQPPQLTAPLTTTDASCSTCNDGSSIVTPGGGTGSYTYSWSTTPVQYGQTATNLSPGVYTCCVYDANGCVLCVSDSVSFPSSVSLISEEDNSIAIIPNPFTNQITLICKSSTLISLFDYTGKEILHQKTFSGEAVLNTEALAVGLYFLKVDDGRGENNYKVVKQ
jgi:hypothetical protein